ncbi:uncharacterized protein N7515_009349 [Penicillium bovifimosum]|uniref:Uncharacterized protein n=1 Tax=Penicillium bovifimosum TaxID=126998 RepID=A0A9W9KVQ7_9EURO|nr:uncharacterized protein N7515_009349 [Penicillium bovifimosum]KAJ5121388.1 hypothetical protein N7515_009349 [Penicillium bovifimosum]
MDGSTLLCIICPGEPRFCDVSHLLTHAASKSHLSHLCKLQLRTSDPNAVELLKQFHNWVDSHGLAEKLSSRLEKRLEKQHKQDKQRKKSGQASTSTFGQTVNRALNVELEESITPAADSASAYLDPRLVDCHNGEEKKYARFTPSTPGSLPTLSSHDLPMTPSHHLNRQDGTWDSREPTSDPFVESDNHMQASGSTGINKDRAEELARLKGIQWPGMDIFDSATPQMRRQRNQKKDGSVLKQMEMASLLAKPNELVYNPEGKLLRERVITGNVEEYSPLKGETPLQKQRTTRLSSKRLTTADPNVPRAADRKRQKTTARNGRNAIQAKSIVELSSNRRSGLGAARTQPHDAIDEDYDLTYKPHGNRGRRRFNIFADGEQEMQAINDEQNLGHTGPVDTVTPSRLVLNGKTNSSIQSGIGAPIVAKENLEPIFNPQGRIGPHGSNTSLASYPDTGGYGIGNGYYGLQGTYGGNGNFGLHCNHRYNPLVQVPMQSPMQNPMQAPLQASLQAPLQAPPKLYANHHEQYVGAQNSWLSPDQNIPSEETIPEEEEFFYTNLLAAPMTETDMADIADMVDLK